MRCQVHFILRACRHRTISQSVSESGTRPSPGSELFLSSAVNGEDCLVNVGFVVTHAVQQKHDRALRLRMDKSDRFQISKDKEETLS